MKTGLLFCLCIQLLCLPLCAYESLDKNNPIVFKGDYFVYKGDTVRLNAKAFFIDGQFSDEEVKQYPYVFNSLNEAVKHLTEGVSDSDRMVLYVAPYVYWIDDPDDPEIRKPKRKHEPPFGLEIDCPWLKIVGLTDNPENVVFASNRGQAQGAVGNFTMFHFKGDGLSLHNLTFGNYCNVDLVYPLDAALNRPKRMSSITQAQLAFADGDRLEAHNVRFISRLNTCPLNGGRRTLFDRCYFESTDDALCGTGVYLNCGFTFYGSKPFYATSETGAVFLNCDMYVRSGERQYLTKAESPMILVDCRFHTERPVYLGWTQDPTPRLRCYQSNVTCNGKAVTLSADVPDITVDMTGKPLLAAYRVENKGKVVYNTYNLLCGDDNWDPMGVKDEIVSAPQVLGYNVWEIPVSLGLSSRTDLLEAGQTGHNIIGIAKRHNGYDARIPELEWECDTALLLLKGDNSQKIMYSINGQDSVKRVILRVRSDIGLEASKVLTVSPKELDVPAFSHAPYLEWNKKEKELALKYELDLQGRADQSIITWYRCTSPDGSHAIPVKVGRDKPETFYRLDQNDVGYYIMAGVSPKHIRSKAGKETRVVWNRIVSARMVHQNTLYRTDFKDFPVMQQAEVLPGFWTVDGYKPSDTEAYEWEADSVRNWVYGEGLDAARGYKGLMQVSRGARLMFTPVHPHAGDMEVNLLVAPCKQAAQGFGSPTGQYMDVCLKFDTKTLTGYGLRIIRTVKYHNAVDFYLVRYDKGRVIPISDAVSGICYLPECKIQVKTEGNRLSAHVLTDAVMRETDDPALHKEIRLSAIMEDESPDGGFCLQHTGSGYASATLLCSLELEWK